MSTPSALHHPSRGDELCARGKFEDDPITLKYPHSIRRATPASVGFRRESEELDKTIGEIRDVPAWSSWIRGTRPARPPRAERAPRATDACASPRQPVRRARLPM